ncbi:MAG TPA: flavin reductase family protein [Candidatus Competibacteraceae bacterium]|nr:flavin reductase family protein [Candidatus Competibacteraceae bacterium]
MSTEPLDPRELRKALGAFVTGVTVVTTLDSDGTPRGFTANSFTSVSLDPPLILVCVGKHASSHGVFVKTTRFAVNILAETQKSISSTFAAKAPDKFAGVAWRHGRTGSPLLADVAAWLDCEMHEVIEVGDHAILFGRVVDFGYQSSTPLGYCRGNYLTFGLEQEALNAASHDTRVGAILEGAGDILFLDDGAGGLVLPEGSSLNGGGDDKSLLKLLARLGFEVEISFLFAVFEHGGRDHGAIYYRGEITGGTPTEARVRMVPLQEIPWQAVKDRAVCSMLQRYVAERLENRFGIYVGGAETGKVQALA